MAVTVVYILMIVLGGFMVYLQIGKGRKCTEEATAVVVGRETKRIRSGKGRRRTEYHPVLEFTAGEQTVRKAADISSIFPGKYKDGDTLEIRYDPENPEEFLVKGKSFRTYALGGALLILMGAVGLYFRFQ